MEPLKDTETVETQGGATIDVQPFPSPLALAVENFPKNLSHAGRYAHYSVFGSIFEVPAKYKPPVKALGRGAYGIVCSALDSETNDIVAIKKIVNTCDNKINAKRTLREIKLLRHLEHENIIGIRDIIVPRQRYDFEDVYIAYDLMDTDLDRVIASKQELTHDHYQYFMYQILRGLKYIHSANVLHRDLKPSNLLVNMHCELKICDFGLARAASDSEAMTEYVATRWYRAPELLLNSSAYTKAIDIWSVGCIFMELVTRKPLFPGKDNVHQLRLILEFLGSPSEDDLGALNESAKRYLAQLPCFTRQSFFENFPDVPSLALELMEKMLKFDPRKRITVDEALDDPYLSSLHDITDEPGCPDLFDFGLDENTLSVEHIREIIYHEALAFNPEAAEVEKEQ